MNRIKYVFYRSGNLTHAPFSLSPDYSDTFENQMILNSLVGTLVKFGTSGRLEPYLADSWHRSSDGLHWTFKLKDALMCEDGTQIDAKKFVHKLSVQLKSYSKKSNVIAFNSLEGWQEFAAGGEPQIRGLYADDQNQIHLHFTAEPEELLNYLRMVYFGYWCDANFIDGKFRDDGKFVSSAAYRLKSQSDSQSLVIERNPSWKTVSVIDEVEFRPMHFDRTIGDHRRTIVRFGNTLPEFDDQEHFFNVRTVPTLLTAAILSPKTESGMFKDPKNREVFRNRLRSFNFDASAQQQGIVPSNQFYAASEDAASPIPSLRDSYTQIPKKIRVNLSTPPGTPTGNQLQKLLRVLFAEIPEEHIEVEYFSVSDKALFKRMISNEFYDLRISSVDVGAKITTSVIDMMFCSSMGVSFPDPDKRVCELTHSYKMKNRMADESFLEQFDKIMREDGYVHPIFRTGINIFYSKDFDPASVPSGSGYPRFEDIRFKDGDDSSD